MFGEGLDFELGGVRAQVRHVGGDHADDSTVVYVEPDGVLFLGDCLYEAPTGGYTVERATPLLAAVRSFAAVRFVEGHTETVLSRAELEKAIAEVTGQQVDEAPVLGRLRVPASSPVPRTPARRTPGNRSRDLRRCRCELERLNG